MRGRLGPQWLIISALVLLCASCSGNRFAYSGTLQPESAGVGSTIGGRVLAVTAADGQRVQRGQILVQLDDKDQRAALGTAVSQEAQAAAALADLEAGARPEEIARARAAKEQAKAQYDKALLAYPHQLSVARQNVNQTEAGLAQARATESQASANYERAQRLFSAGAISAQALDDARASNANAQAAVAAAQARLNTAVAQLNEAEKASLPQDVVTAQQSYASAVANLQLVEAGARPQALAQARAALGAATASVAAAQSRLAEMVVRAPTDGIVESLDLLPGDLVGPRAQVAVVREFRDPYVRIYVAQHDLGKIKVGDRVSVRSDALAGERFDGTIEYIDQDAQFTPRDVQTTEDRADLTYGVKVRVHDPDRKLHGGTTVEVAL